MRLTLSLTILCVFACTFTMNAQNMNNNTRQQTNKQYIDNQGVTYYLDNNGVPYYIDQYGKPFYYDNNNRPFYYDQRGNVVYYDQNNNRSNNSRPNANYPSNQQYNSGQAHNRNNSNYNRNNSNYNNPNSMAYIATDEIDKFRFAIGGGYSFKLGEDIDNRSGYNLDLNAQYFLAESYGIGILVHHAAFKPIDGINLKEKTTLLAPSFVVRSNADSFTLLYNIGIGPLFYKASYKGLSETKTIVGVNSGVSGEYKIDEKLALGLKLAYTYGSFHEDYSCQKVNASSLSLTAFVSFRAK